MIGIVRFAARAWPAVLEAVPGARLDVAGSVRAGAPGPGVAFVGEVDDLKDWYPALPPWWSAPWEVQGSGVKIKMIEALRYGKAVVATSAAVEGLRWRTSRPGSKRGQSMNARRPRRLCCCVPMTELR